MPILRTLLLSLFVLLCASPALAQSDADRATARSLAVEAQKALEAKDYATAADKFKRAEDIFHAPTLVLGLARAYAGMGKYVEALESYNKVIREKLGDSASDAFKQAVEDAKQEVGEVEAKVAWVVLEVEGPTSPTITLDGETLSTATLGVRRAVNPGEHLFAATAPGFSPGEERFTMASGQEQTVRITLEPGEGEIDPPRGGETTKDDTLLVVGAVALGVGGAGLILGAITGGLAIGKHGELTDGCDDGLCPAALEDTLDDYRTLGTISTVGFIAGGVLAALGVTLIVVDVTSSPDGSDTVSLELGPTSASATWRF
jgi:hypothetical protein